jgi:NADPH:quinone reductase-like Zn-dependent oxidoreductase
MRAIAIDEYGGPEVLHEADLPEPKLGPDGVLIRVAAAGVNPVDWKIRKGGLDGAFPAIFPIVPGWDVAGTVERAGPAVTSVGWGDPVYAYARKHFLGEGTYAELVTVQEMAVAPAPPSLDLEQAGALPLTGLTALQALTRGLDLSEGDTLLVHAAAGGVGSFAVQIAKARGARVIGTARAEKHDYLRRLGADEAIDYTEADAAEAARELSSGGVDAVLDPVGGDTLERSVEALRDGGRLCSIVQPPTDERYRVRGIRPSYVFVRPSAEQLRELAELVEAGRLRVHLEEAFPLEQAAAAHERSEAGHVTGKLVLRVA